MRMEAIRSRWPVRPTVNFSGPAWSPDGKRLAWASNKDTAGGPTELYVLEPLGHRGFPTRITMNPEDDFAPSGRLTAQGSRSRARWTMWLRRRQPDLTSINADGFTGLLRLHVTTSSTIESPAWSPDGTRILFNRGPVGGPVRHQLDPRRRCAPGMPLPCWGARRPKSNPDWLPDGHADRLPDRQWSRHDGARMDPARRRCPAAASAASGRRGHRTERGSPDDRGSRGFQSQRRWQRREAAGD